ncbi:MAG TPA: hypothetical protein VIL85_03260, partial [Thermomicrobiales bacterium]
MAGAGQLRGAEDRADGESPSYPRAVGVAPIRGHPGPAEADARPGGLDRRVDGAAARVAAVTVAT